MSGLKKSSRTKSLSLNEDFPLRAQQRNRNNLGTKKVEDAGKILKYIDDGLIGKGVAFLGPFGRRKVVYADYASSGRSLQFLEDYVNKEVLPAYGDINTTSSVTGLQSLLYYKEAKDLIRLAVNASSDDEVIFSEAAYSSPIERLTLLLCSNTNCDEPSPILIVSTSEPDENLRPWQDSGVQIERIVKTREGFLDLVDLEKKLTNYAQNQRKMMALFSGASRMTGILADDVATTILLHQYGAISIWDYSFAAPYSMINTNPTLPGAAKDVVFFCANKFIGGVQAPSVLVIKKKLLSERSQSVYDSVGIIGAVRAGLVVQLKETIGTQCIANRQEKLCKQMLAHIRTIPEIILLGPMTPTAKRIPTIAFLVKHPRGAYLHHRFVVAVLNDVFGIQVTAKNHIVESMGITNKLTVDYERILADDSINIESMRPGYTQITFPYFMSDAEFGFISEALKMVATEAWKLLPQYEVDDKTGEWRHHSNSLIKERKWLGAIRYTDGRMLFSDRRISGPGAFPQNYSDCLQTARNLFNRSRKMAQKNAVSDTLILKLDKNNAELLRWYMLPGEAHELLLGHSLNVKITVPFDPNKSKKTLTPPSILNLYRHNSLSALDVKRFKSRSLPTSPIHMPVQRQQSTPGSPIPNSIPDRRKYTKASNSIIERLSPISGTPIRIEIPNRNRCNSWSSSNGVYATVNTQLQNKLGIHTFTAKKPRQRMCSCSSQTDLEDVVLLANTPPAQQTLIISPLATNNNDKIIYCTTANQQSNCIHTDTEDIKAYVKVVTSELATEIKSEIREVISKVEDVLDSTDNSDISSNNINSLYNISSADDMRNDSVSATDVAEYLKEFSIDITNQVKSEIREIVNVMNENEQNFLELQFNRRNSPLDIFEKPISYPAKEKLKHRFSDITPKNNDKLPMVINENKQRSESVPIPSFKTSTTASSPEHSTPSCPYTGAISKLIDPISAASQDSGINMYFQDVDDTRLKSISESQSERQRISSTSTQSNVQELLDCNSNNIDNKRSTSKCKCISIDLKRDITNESDKERGDEMDKKWQYLPIQVWKQTSEAMDEFDMVKDGDKILACLSGSSASLCLLHAIRQYSRARGIHVEIGALSLSPSGVDPRALMLYLRDLDINYILDQLNPIESLRSKLYTIARQKGYNVIALGNSLDKLADDFLVSVLNKGRLYTTQAHCFNRDGDLRIIRPFVYVREKQLEDFAIQKDLPSRPSKIFTKPPDASNSILKVQEITNPNVYENIKHALKPLLFMRIDINKTTFDCFKPTSLSRE